MLVAVLTVVLFIALDVGIACAEEANAAKSMLATFETQTAGWWALLQSYAKDIFILTLTLEVALFGIRMGFQQTQLNEIIGQFVMLLLFAGFIAAVIMNYEAWAKAVALNGLKPLVTSLNPTMEVVDAGQPFAIAAKVWEAVMDAARDAGFWDFPKVFMLEIIALIICVVLALISALVILVTCEFYIVANVGVLLIGLGGSKIFKDYAVNVMRYILSVAVKLFVLQLICNIGFSIITLATIQQATAGGVKVIQIQELFIIVGQAIILLALAKSLPDTCAGILSGSHIGGGNPLASMGRAAGGVAMGMATAGAGYAIGAAKGAAALKSSYKTAGAINEGQGKSGFANRVKTMAAGKSQGNMEKNKHTMTNTLKSQLAGQQAMQAKQERKANKQKQKGG